MYSETYSQSDFYFLPPLDRNDDDNYFVFNKYIQNPCISTIEENPIINEPQKNPRFDTNIEDDNSKKNEEDKCKIIINNTDINLQKIGGSNILKQIKENRIKIINHWNQINLKNLIQQIKILKRSIFKKRKKKKKKKQIKKYLEKK